MLGAWLYDAIMYDEWQKTKICIQRFIATKWVTMSDKLTVLSYLIFIPNHLPYKWYKGLVQGEGSTKYNNRLRVKLYYSLEKCLQTQESHSGTVSRPNPGSWHTEERSENWTLAILLNQSYHCGVGAWVQQKGGSCVHVTCHGTYHKREQFLVRGEHG